jgi:integrase
MPIHKLMDGDLQVFKRTGRRHWQCAASIGGRQYRHSTKEESLSHAKEIAKDWYLEKTGKSRAGLLKTEKTFKDAAEKFTVEYGVITKGERSPKWVQGHQIRLRLHLLPFFGAMGLSEITPGTVQDYRVHRMQVPTEEPNTADQAPTPKVAKRRGKSADGIVADGATAGPGTAADGKTKRKRGFVRKPKPPARSTLHDEVVTLRMVLKTAVRHGWLGVAPDIDAPYNTQGKVVHRPWFSPEEYKKLYATSREHARNTPQPQYRWNAEQLHDYILFMGNTGLRPDEAKNLQHRDVMITSDYVTGEKILEIEVRGKRGVGFCKSMPGAVRPYERLLNRPKPTRGKQKRNRSKKNPNPALPVELPEPTDPVFPGDHLKLFNGMLEKADLKYDRDGKPRTSYSLRHTYICLRLMEGADIYQIAKNCRTSVEMIEKHYAAHIKNTLDTAAINVMRSKAVKALEKSAKQGAHANSNSNGNGAGKPKPDTKPSRIEKAARKRMAQDAMRDQTDELEPGDLTSEM